MSNELPLYYAIMKHFENGKPDCTEGVMHDLAASYSSYKLFTRKDIDEALATAKENGLLDECDWEIWERYDSAVYQVDAKAAAATYGSAAAAHW